MRKGGNTSNLIKRKCKSPTNEACLISFTIAAKANRALTLGHVYCAHAGLCYRDQFVRLLGAF